MKSLIFPQDLELYGILIGQYSDHMTWDLMRLWAYRDSRIGLLVKDTLKETLKSHFLWYIWRFGLKKLLNPTSCEISGDFG